jgi:uncharacterized membrane protein (DUF373 family)
MITLGILLLALFVISIYKLQQESFSSYESEEFWHTTAAVGTVLLLCVLIILILIYLP